MQFGMTPGVQRNSPFVRVCSTVSKGSWVGAEVLHCEKAQRWELKQEEWATIGQWTWRLKEGERDWWEGVKTGRQGRGGEQGLEWGPVHQTLEQEELA
jgi:hypothetical protein